MDDKIIDVTMTMAKTLGRIPRNLVNRQEKENVKKRVVNGLYSIRNAQNATSLIKALSDMQQIINKLAVKGVEVRKFKKTKEGEKSEENGKRTVALWIDAELLTYLASPTCEWEKIKYMIVMTTNNYLNKTNNEENSND